jgi:hypothetical protein
MVDSTRGFDELFGPGDRLIIFDKNANDRPQGGDGGGGVEVVVVGGPPKRCPQIGQLHGSPRVRLPLARAVPQRQDVGFAPGEVLGVGGPNRGCRSVGDELFLGELADGLQHRIPGPPG